MIRIAPPRPRRTGKPARFVVETLERRCLLSAGPDPLANFQIVDVLTIPGKAFTLPLASCSFYTTRQLAATIDWGDGTPASLADVRYNSDFFGTHEFAAPGNYAAKLRIDEVFPDGGHFFEDKTIPIRVAAPSIHVAPGSVAVARNIPGHLAGPPTSRRTSPITRPRSRPA